MQGSKQRDGVITVTDVSETSALKSGLKWGKVEARSPGQRRWNSLEKAVPWR